MGFRQLRASRWREEEIFLGVLDGTTPLLWRRENRAPDAHFAASIHSAKGIGASVKMLLTALNVCYV